MLGKLSAAMGDTFDPTAMAAAQNAGGGEGEQEEEEGPLDVHGAASNGLFPVTACPAEVACQLICVLCA